LIQANVIEILTFLCVYCFLFVSVVNTKLNIGAKAIYKKVYLIILASSKTCAENR